MKFILVFLEGVLSFVSPCMLPVLPIYLTILSSSSIEGLEGRDESLKKGVLFKNTLLFILGVSTVFFLIGTSISALGQFIFNNKQIISQVGGILIILMGLFYMGYLKIPFLQQERKFHMQVKEMKPWTAYFLGFTFSFGWTPCIGPMLASVLMMASVSETALIGNLLIATYSIGFMVPFVVIAFCYRWVFKLLDKIKLHMGTLQKIGGIILIGSGTLMILGGGIPQNITVKENPPQATKEQEKTQAAPDFTLYDQYGNKHTLSEYKGKVVFLNFWATWCPPCRAEMPDIQRAYEKYGENEEEVIILGLASPGFGNEKPKADITAYLENNNINFPVAFDESEHADLSYFYSIEAYPTTIIINKEGNVAQYFTGAMPYDMMEELIEKSR